MRIHSIEMSVKAFLTKYFQPESSKVSPEDVLEPMIGSQRRNAVALIAPSQSSQSVPSSDSLHIFVDGACTDNGKRGAKGGFGVHVYGTPSFDISRSLFPHEQQTNNRAELRAIQAALDLIDQHGAEWFKTHAHVTIWSDSEYSIHCLTKWAKGWASHGWKKKDGGLIQNLDVVKPLYERLQRMPRVSFHHVRGHQDFKKNQFPFDGNIKADALATASIH
jgi:ribonuclease HI